MSQCKIECAEQWVARAHGCDGSAGTIAALGRRISRLAAGDGMDELSRAHLA